MIKLPTLAVHYQCYAQPKAVIHALRYFRKLYPNSYVRMVSNNGIDLSHIATYFGCDYVHSNIATSVQSTYCLDGEMLKVYVGRLYQTALRAKEDYIMILSEDIRFFKPIKKFGYDLNGGRGYWKRPIFRLFNRPFNLMRAGGDGIVFRRQFILDHFSTASEAIDILEPKMRELFKQNPTPFPSDGCLNMLVLHYGGTIGPYNGYTDPTRWDYPVFKFFGWLRVLHGYTEMYNKELTDYERSIVQGTHL